MEDVSVAELRSVDVKRATELLATHDQAGLRGRDATVLAAMERHAVSRLWTQDGALKRLDDRFDWFSVTDPVME